MHLKYNCDLTPKENLDELLKDGGYGQKELETIEVVSTEVHSGDDGRNTKLKLKVPAALAERIKANPENQVEITPAEEGDDKIVTHYFKRLDLVTAIGVTSTKPINSIGGSELPTLNALVTEALTAKKLDKAYQLANAEDPELANKVAFGRVYEVRLVPKEGTVANHVVLNGSLYLRVGVDLEDTTNRSLFRLRFFSPNNGAATSESLNNEGAGDAKWNKVLRLVNMDARTLFTGTPYNHWVKDDYAADKRTFLESVVGSLGSYVKPASVDTLTTTEEMGDKLNTANQGKNADYTYITLVDDLVNHDATTGDPKWYIQRRELKEAFPEFNSRIESGHVNVSQWNQINRSLSTLEGNENNALLVSREGVSTREQANDLLQEVLDFFNQYGWDNVTEEEETSVVAGEFTVLKCFKVKQAGEPYAKGKVYIGASYTPEAIRITGLLNGFEGIINKPE